MPKIIEIVSGLPEDGTTYTVGKETGYRNGKFVTKIKDLTNEWPDSIDRQYDIYVNDKLYVSWINMPVQVFYDDESVDTK